MRSRPSRWTVAPAAAIVGLATLTLPVLAQGAGGGDPHAPAAAPRDGASGGRQAAPDDLPAGDLVAALAAELDVPLDELRTAIATVRASQRPDRLSTLRQRLDERVAAGDLTRERADRLYARAEARARARDGGERAREAGSSDPEG